jgi:hypothetical protein
METGIRARVIGLALISALPLLAFDLYEAREAQREAVKRAQHEALLLARSFAARQDDVFDETRGLLSGFAVGF